MSQSPDMTVEIAGLKLRNPIIAASGTFGYGLEFSTLLDLNELGGFVVKGLSREPMRGNPPPRLVETPSGMMNSVGLQNIGVDAFVREKLPLLAQLKTAVIANIFGSVVEDYLAVVEKLEKAQGLSAYELNLSCPNTKNGGILFGSDPVLVEEITRSIKASCRRPVFVKLSPNVADIAPFAKAAENGGADGISLANTFVGMYMPRPAAQHKIPQGAGGLSGPAIHALAVRLVHRAASVISIPVIGIGGVICGTDAAEFLLSGAAAVQVGTANFYDPLATVRIIRELTVYCRRSGVQSIKDLHPRGQQSVLNR